MTVSKPMRFRDSRLIRTGLALLIIGSTPLFAIIIAARLGLTSDPNPNPVGPGMLVFLTFWPSIGLILAGMFSVWVSRTEKKS